MEPKAAAVKVKIVRILVVFEYQEDTLLIVSADDSGNSQNDIMMGSNNLKMCPNLASQFESTTRTTRKVDIEGLYNTQDMWTQEEDILLTSLGNKYGTKHWKMISESIPGRSGKQVGMFVSYQDLVSSALVL